MLCYYFSEQSIPLGEDLAQGFESLGHTVLRFESDRFPHQWGFLWKAAKSLSKLLGLKPWVAARHDAWLSERLSQRFIAAAGVFCPEQIVVIQGERVDARTVQTVCRQYGAKSVLWWVRPPRWQASIYEDRPYYDKVLTIDSSSATGGIGHLPSWALNRKVYYAGPVEEKEKVLLFVGSYSPLRQTYLESITDLPLKIIGSGWHKKLPREHPLYARIAAPYVGGRNLAEAYRRAWAVVDIPQFEQTEGQGVNMRFADVPACGTVLITPDTLEARQWFGELAAVPRFANLGQLRQQCEAILSEAVDMAVLSKEATRAAEKLPTFGDRATVLLGDRVTV